MRAARVVCILGLQQNRNPFVHTGGYVDPNTSRFKFFAELVSAVAVVLSLVFVGLEVRETARQTQLNTEALRLAAYQDLISQIAQFNTAMLDSASASVYLRISAPDGEWSALSPIEQNQADRILFLLARHADMAFYQFEQGLLSRDRLDSAIRPFTGDLHSPIYLEFWERARGNFVPSFRAHIDARVAAP